MGTDHEETITIDLGFLGMAEKGRGTATYEVDPDKTDMENLHVMAAAVTEALNEALAEALPYYESFVDQREQTQ